MGAPYTSVGIFAQGVNGRLPNVDLITCIVQSFGYESVPVFLHGNSVDPILDRKMTMFDKYVFSALNLMNFVRYQAIGFPAQAHGLFTRYLSLIKVIKLKR
jgi:hypothetical protein